MSKRFRIFISVVLILITLLSFKGFPYAAYDVKNTTVIQGVGIDYDEKEGFILTVEIFDASQSSGVDEVSSGNLTKVITVKGEDISSAMDELTLKIGKTLIYSQKRVVVISKDALPQGVTNVMDFFVRDYKTRSSVLVAATVNCTAADVMSANEGNVSFPARELQELLKSGKINGYTTEVDFATLTELTKDKYTSAYLPVFDIQNSGKDTFAALSGFLVLSDEKPKGVLSLEEGRGFLFLCDAVSSGTVSIKNENLGFSSLRIVSNDTRVGVSADAEPHFVVNIDCTMDIMEMKTENDIFIDEGNSGIIAKNAEEYIEKITRDTLKKCLDDWNCDIFGFGRRLWILYPSYCRRTLDTKEKAITSDLVDVNAHVFIRRVGQGNV